jgi:hypothetical protein
MSEFPHLLVVWEPAEQLIAETIEPGSARIKQISAIPK